MVRSTKLSPLKSFRWTRKDSVYIGEIDAEHRDLFRMIARLAREIASGAPLSRVQTMADETLRHAAGHFAHEERRMAATNCAYYPWHKKQHATAARNLRRLALSLEAGDRDTALALLNSTAGGLRDHIGLSDRMMAAHFRAFALRTGALPS